MDQFDEIHRERITALLQAIYATKSIRDDSVPCQIEEVVQVDMKLLFYWYFVGILFAFYFLKDFAIVNSYIFYWISQGLYLGSLGAANNRSALKSLNITHILTVASSLPPAYPNEFKYKIVVGRKVFDLIHIVFLNISYLFAMVEFDFYLIILL